MFQKVIIFLWISTILSFPQDNIFFRDENFEIGSTCRTTSQKIGTCVLGEKCKDPFGGYSVSRKSSICFFQDKITPVVCCSNDLIIQDKDRTDTSGTLLEDTLPRPVFIKLNYTIPPFEISPLPEDKTTSSTISSISPVAVNIAAPQSDSSQLARISAIKCKEYSQNFTTDPYVEADLPIYIAVVGGIPANVGEFPHMAAIGLPDPDGNGTKFVCGGSLISERYILTAAHCFTRDPPTVIRLGELDLTNDDAGETPRDYGIEQIISHPNYKASSVYNDIALIRLNETVQFYKFVRPACLPQEDAGDDGLRLTAYGWGHTSFGGVESDYLQKVTLSTYLPKDCSEQYPVSRRLKDGLIKTQICAGDSTGLKDTCQGDSGGPLSMSINIPEIFSDIHYILGVTSFGQGCGSEIPAIYTRVFSYLDWIESIVWNAK